MSDLLRLYPGWWRTRYQDEVRALLEVTPRRKGDRADLLRGVLDAWLHPPIPSRIPGAAALAGGGIWTVLAAGVVSQPVPPDWPGYVVEAIPLALLAAALLLVALVGVAIRGFDVAGRRMGLLAGLAIAAYVAWMAALVGSLAAITDAPTLAAAQAIAMIATVAIGAMLIRLGDAGIGALVLLAGTTLLIPWAWAWLGFGAAWTAIGITLLVERRGRIGTQRGVA